MRPVSAAFLRTLRGSHTAVFRATVCSTFQSTTSPTGTRIPILGGDVQIDGTAQIRSTVDMVTDGTGMWPTSAGSLLAPYGNEVYIERGLIHTDAEYVGLGYFRIQGPEQDYPPDGPIRLSGRDRMAGLIDAELPSPQQFGTTASFGYIMATLVGQVYPLAVIEWDDATSAALLTRPLICEKDRFGFLDDLVKSRGKIWYWDYRGVLVIRSPPNPANPVFDVDAGAGGVLLTVARHLTRDGVYNAVVASGEAFDTFPPVRAIAYDANQASATYYYGPFGPTPKFFTSPSLFTPGQAAVAAEAELRRVLGLPYSMDLTAVANPALEPWDPVAVRIATSQRRETHILDKVTVPLTADGAMTATTREQTIVLVGTA